jgi:hypothetical protein
MRGKPPERRVDFVPDALRRVVKTNGVAWGLAASASLGVRVPVT